MRRGAATRAGGALAATAAAVLILDRLTKWLVVEAMDLRSVGVIEVWPGFVSLRMAWNRGMNFGILSSDLDFARWGLAGLAAAISIGVAVWALRRGQRWFSLGAGALIGGALGNAWDRVQHGAVADFLNVTCCGVVNPFGLNGADVASFEGAAALAFAPHPGAHRA